MFTSKGFTLIETVIVLAVLGIVAAIVIPRMSNILPAAREQDAIARAYTLNQAVFTYTKRISAAPTNWAAATTNADKYLLLWNASFLPGCPPSLAAFQPSGYSFAFDSNLAVPRVVITGPNGVLAYN